MKKRSALCLVLSAVAFGPIMAGAQVPQLINYQGRLLNGTNLVNGNVGLSLRLFNVPSGGSSLYEDSNSVAVVDGLYSTLIGDNPTNSAFIDALSNASVWVEVAVNGTALSPRERLAAVGYSLSTRGVHVATNGSVVLNARQEPGANSIHPASAHSVIGGGEYSVIRSNSWWSTISGGFSLYIFEDARFATIGGGENNLIGQDADGSTIGGGAQNSVEASNLYSTVAGGSFNKIRPSSGAATIGGGFGNTIASNASYATIPGGRDNDVGANADYAFAAGRNAKASHPGAFVWADDSAAEFGSSATNQFLIRASGGVGIGVTNPSAVLQVKNLNDVGGIIRIGGNTAVLAERRLRFGDGDFCSIGESSTEDDRMELRAGSGLGKGFHFTSGRIGVGIVPTTNIIHTGGGAFCSGDGTTWVNASDKNLKDGFQPVDTGAVLEKVAALPLTTWHYKSEGEARQHLGPMAQDFSAAFGLGYDDKSISTVDASGVALAAIQALAAEDGRQRTEDRGQQAEIEVLKQTILELRARLDALEKK